VNKTIPKMLNPYSLLDFGSVILSENNAETSVENKVDKLNHFAPPLPTNMVSSPVMKITIDQFSCACPLCGLTVYSDIP
jgi:hypothetical protein